MRIGKESSKNGDIEQETDIKQLFIKVLENEKRYMHRYEKIADQVKDKEIKGLISGINRDEEKHIDELEKIYFRLTKDVLHVEAHKESCKKNLRDLFRKYFDEEMEMIETLTEIYKLINEEELKEKIACIIADEQVHASKFMTANIKIRTKDSEDFFFRALVTVVPNAINRKTDVIEEELRIPEVQGMANLTIQKHINDSMRNDIIEFKNQMEIAALEGSQAAKAQGKKFVPYVISTNYTVPYNKNNILSISLIYSEYIGGRPSYIVTSYNYDTVTGRSLMLSDLFKPGVPYRGLLNQAIRRELQSNKAIYPPGAAAQFKGVAEDQPFYIDNINKDIVIYFGFNEIAPTVAQIPIIRIPFSEFRNQIKPMFLT